MHTALYTHPIATDIASALVVIIEVWVQAIVYTVLVTFLHTDAQNTQF